MGERESGGVEVMAGRSADAGGVNGYSFVWNRRGQ